MSDLLNKSLETALVSSALRDEFLAKVAAPAVLSAELDEHLELALVDADAFAEVKNAVENGIASLSKRSGDILSIALASEAAAKELFTF